MQDPVSTPVVLPPIITALPPQEEVKAPETPPAPEAPPAQEQVPEAPKEEEVLPEGVEKGEDGQLVITEGSTVYKGKDLNELLSNVRKGISEKDKYISQLKSKATVKVPDDMRGRKVVEGEEESLIESDLKAPDREEIFREIFDQAVKRHNLDPAKFRWTNQQWRDYADQGGLRDFEVSNEIQRIRQVWGEVNSVTDAKYSEQNVSYINESILDEETERVRELLAESGVEQSDFDYREVLERVYSNPKNKNALGVLRSGTITAEAVKEIRKIAGPKEKSALQKKLEEDIARGKKAKGEVKEPTPSAAPFKESPKPPANYDDAHAKALKMFLGKS